MSGGFAQDHYVVTEPPHYAQSISKTVVCSVSIAKLCDELEQFWIFSGNSIWAGILYLGVVL